MRPKLILGSSSKYRGAALQTLGLSFTQVSPDIDETPQHAEHPQRLAQRLAAAKANVIASQHPGAVVIGSDQVGWCEGRYLGKPGKLEAAKLALSRNSGRKATFYTGLAVCQFDSAEGVKMSTDVIATELQFRVLSETEIDHYVSEDRPIDSAGGFKAESLGIALFEYVKADDPSALIGLPLITLVSRLREFGINPLSG